jgi:hypothetical protein
VIEPAAFEPHPDPIEQWLRWEEQANLLGFRTSTEPVELAVAEVPRSRVGVETGPRTPAPIAARFLLGDRVRYPKHPLNRDASVAFHDEPEQGRWLARYTSSRTLVVVDGEAGARFSIKASTDHPHPDFVQPEKTRLREEAEDAMRFARRIDAVDARLGADPALLLVKEVMTVLAVGSEHGFVVRDLAPLHDGSHYLPGLSVPFAGPAIARRLGAAFAELWGRFYAESVGRAKAKLLARSCSSAATCCRPARSSSATWATCSPSSRRTARRTGAGRCARSARRRATRSGPSTAPASTRSRPTCSTAGASATTAPT